MEEDLKKHVERHDRQISEIKNLYLAPATEHHLGTMSAQDKRDLTHATGVRQWIYDKTSVLDLPKGHYETLWRISNHFERYSEAILVLRFRDRQGLVSQHSQSRW